MWESFSFLNFNVSRELIEFQRKAAGIIIAFRNGATVNVHFYPNSDSKQMYPLGLYMMLQSKCVYVSE